MASTGNSFGSRSTLKVGKRELEIHRLAAVEKAGLRPARLPFSLRILLENLLRHEDGDTVTEADIRALCAWDPAAEPSKEIAFTPARVLLQDITGIPALIDLAALRDAVSSVGGDAGRVNPLLPVDMVVDHSLQVDEFGTPNALTLNAQIELARNRERYSFLRWAQSAFRNLQVVPPGAGIVHQVNLEHLARVVFTTDGRETAPQAYPDTVIGTDPHTTMVNALGVMGWGTGGVEAELAMLGQPISMRLPQVMGVRLHGRLRESVTAMDLVLTITQFLRKQRVVGKIVEFLGLGVSALSLPDRATIANMAPEYGAICGVFPIDGETLRYLRSTGRGADHVELVEAYATEQGLFHHREGVEAEYSEVLDLDLGSVEPSVSGPKRPQDRVSLSAIRQSFEQALPSLAKPRKMRDERESRTGGRGIDENRTDIGFAPAASPAPEVKHGSIVIAAITSCMNTSNPSAILAAGLLAKKAVDRRLSVRPWVKTSLAPGSKVVTDYLREAGLLPYLETLGFHTVGYGCTTCVGNSGPLPRPVSDAIEERGLAVVSVLSGNRNFEGRINPDVRANYLMSPPLVVAFALVGTVDVDLDKEPLGWDQNDQPVYLRDLWPTSAEVNDVIAGAMNPATYKRAYAALFRGDERWQKLDVPGGDAYVWDSTSTYIKQPPLSKEMSRDSERVADVAGARALAVLGDAVTTDLISPAGSIKKASPAGRYLIAHGVDPKDFNSYGARRGNHELMLRGTFANVRLQNLLAPGTEGGVTRHLPDGEIMSIFEASEKYAQEGTPLIVIAGKGYGSGSARDWAAKGPRLLGVRVVIAQGYEPTHRSNLVAMGILPLQFQPGDSPASLGLTGDEVYATVGLAELLEGTFAPGRLLTVRASGADKVREFPTVLRIDTPREVAYYRHGGVLPHFLRQVIARQGG